MSTEKLKEAAQAEGYEIGYHSTKSGNDTMELIILVKMSNRKLCGKDSFYAAADMIEEGLIRVTNEQDPNRYEQIRKYREEIEMIYDQAGVKSIYIQQIPNGYCQKACCLNKPWFKVTSSIGHIILGWRRFVLSIDWSDSDMKGRSGQQLFPDEDVIKLDAGIHAHSIQNAIRYIKELHK